MSLARNAAFNLTGALVPAVAALLTVPVLIAHLGTSSYGVLVLVTSIVGYFALLDVNATAGSVKFIAEHQARGDSRRVGQVLGFGLALYLGIGAVGGGLIAAFAEPLVERVFRVPPALHAEATAALRLAGLAFLLGQVQQYLQSVPQALQRYDISGRLEAVFGTLVSVASMAAAWAGWGLVGVIAVRIGLSVVNIGLLLRAIARLLPRDIWARPDAATAIEVGRFSGYAYLARVAAISAGHTDKLLIGALVDMRSLAWYSVPFMLINRMFALSFRLSQVIFPRASALAAAGRDEQLRRNMTDAGRYVGFINGALLLLLVALAPEAMHYWAGADFGAEAVFVMTVLAAAVYVDSLTNIPALVNDGLGHPQVTGIGAVLRAAVGLGAAWLAVGEHGITGAAVAQLAVSCLASGLFLLWVHGRTVPMALSAWLQATLLPAAPVLAAAAAAAWWAHSRAVLTPLATAGLLTGLLVLLAAYGWLAVLRPAHRAQALGALRQRLAVRAQPRP